MERGGYTVATTYASSYNIHWANFPKRNCNGRPFRLANFKKQSFRAWKVVFLIFPSRHPWEQAVRFFRCFSSFGQSAIAMGDPSNWQISKTNFSEPEKLFFWFSPPDTLESRQWGFQVLFQLWAKRNCNGRPFQLANFKNQLFRAWKVVFLIFPSRHPWEQALSFSGAFPAAQSAIAMGDPSNWQISKKTTFQSLKSCFLIFPSRKFSGVGKALPPPHPRFEPAWSHKSRENFESWWNEAR